MAASADFTRTGPGTLAGRYLRLFWQPIHHAQELQPGTAVPLRIMSEDFTLYRGESGTPHLAAFRCPHRGTQLSVGWVEGDCIRCFYHGWKYDSSGQCIEQPAEPKPFAPKVRIRSYPVQDYLGLVFAYLGDAEPPPPPCFPEFEEFEGLLEVDSYKRRCNYFQNLENSLDSTHVGFVHKTHEDAYNGAADSPALWVEESDWGIASHAKRPSGAERVTHFGMPNIFHIHALPIDPLVGWQESLFTWVPIDDEQHIQFGVHRLPLAGDEAERYRTRQAQRLAKMDLAHEEVAESILAGRLRLNDVAPDRTDLIRLQDDIAQVGQGRIALRRSERLGHGDAGVVMIRKIWARELTALAKGQPLKHWRRPPSLSPVNRVAPETSVRGQKRRSPSAAPA